MIDINTKFITLIGTPLGQSFAARMQNTAYSAAGLNVRYFYTEADQTCLGDIIAGIRAMPSFLGCAVTKPNKVEVLQYLDELDPLCEKMGACNTVVKTPDGLLKGYNTDGLGFYYSLREEAEQPIEGQTFFCLGAGGAGRAICAVLAHYGARKIYITSRTQESREAVVRDINTRFAPIAKAVEPNDFGYLPECDVVMNTTGIGMGSTVGTSPMPKENMLSRQLCFDACYNPAKTRFLLDAEEMGCRTLNGLGMSLYQGAAQIELWTGKKAPVDVMRQELLKIVAEREAKL